MTYRDLQDILHIGKNKAYELMKSSCFPTIRIGKRMYVNRDRLYRWIEDYTYGVYMV